MRAGGDRAARERGQLAAAVNAWRVQVLCEGSGRMRAQLAEAVVAGQLAKAQSVAWALRSLGARDEGSCVEKVLHAWRHTAQMDAAARELAEHQLAAKRRLAQSAVEKAMQRWHASSAALAERAFGAWAFVARAEKHQSAMATVRRQFTRMQTSRANTVSFGA